MRCQGSLVIVGGSGPGIVRGKGRQAVSCRDRRRGCGSHHRGIKFDGVCVLSVVEVFTAHLSIFSDTKFPGFAADKSSAHGAGHHSCHGKQNSRCEDYPPAPFEMRNKEQNVNQKSQHRHEESWKQQYKETQEVSRGVRRRVEMRSGGETQTYQRKECGYGMDDEQRRKGCANVLREVELVRLGFLQISL